MSGAPLPGDGFREALAEGLAARPRRIPCRYLYDTEGMALFERITGLETYHLCRTETALLRWHARDLARIAGPGCRVVEFGAGSMSKTRLLLDALERPCAYVPVDSAAACLETAAEALAAERPDIAVVPLAADFTRPLALPPAPAGHRVLAFFPGSTIGNMAPPEAAAFLDGARNLIGEDGLLLVGVDMVRDPARLLAAYDDPQGVTARFIRNLLVRANRELGAGFDCAAFDHRVWWNAREGRVEIHLVSRRRQTATLDGTTYGFESGDTIHVEDCYKYGVEQFLWLARLSGLASAALWADGDFSYALHLLKAA